MRRPPAPTEDQLLVHRLPVAGTRTIAAEVRRLLRRHRRIVLGVVGLHGLAVGAGLVGPQVLGRLVEGLGTGVEVALAPLLVAFAAAVVVQTVATRSSRLRAGVLGESVLADLREDFLARSVDLPPGVVEEAGTGDLVTRATTDVDRLTWAVRHAVPEIAIAVVSVVVIGAALVVTAPPLALAWLLAVPPILLASRWYFRRAPAAYRSEMGAYAWANAAVAESVDAGRTVEAYRIGERRVSLTDRRVGYWLDWERYTRFLRTVWFPSVESAYVLPLAVVVGLGGFLVADGRISLAQFTAAVLYTQMLIEPVDLVLMWFDELQVGQASLARLLGVTEVDEPARDPELHPTDEHLAVVDVHFGYRPGAEVLLGVDLGVQPGERLAVVGPSGAGKSTLARLLAGIHPPGLGRVLLGGADVSVMPPERTRRHVVLVTQEQHVFVGPLRDNLLLAQPEADDAELWAAVEVVGAAGWVRALPAGLDTEVGSGGVALTPAQAQQVALARLVVADPHTLILDEATSLLDRRAARTLEQSLSRVLDGRTVVSVAHRLHTAHDADRVAVVEGGRVVELGSHDELVAAGGSYAALWRSWQGNRQPTPRPR
jgi:ABC-type multidrug transport system fused ATPase/permease subunit